MIRENVVVKELKKKKISVGSFKAILSKNSTINSREVLDEICRLLRTTSNKKIIESIFEFDINKEAKIAAVMNKNITQKLLKEILDGKFGRVSTKLKAAIATKINDDEYCLNLTALNKDEIDLGLANNENGLSTELLRKLISYKRKELMIAMASNPKLTDEQKQLIYYLSTFRYEYKIGLSKQKKLSHHITTLLIQYSQNDVKENLALHSEHQDVLVHLASNSYENVRRNVALNKKTPPETLMKLSNDIVGDVRQAVASNKNTYPNTLKKLSRDLLDTVSEAAKSNKKFK